MQKIACTQCQKVLKVSSRLIGKKGLCPRCGTKISFVENQPVESVISLDRGESGIEPAPRQKPVAVPAELITNPVPPARQPARQAVYHPAPVRKKRSWVVPGALAIALTTAGGVGFGLAFPEEAGSVWNKMRGFSQSSLYPEPPFKSMDLEIEKAALPIIEKIWEDYPRLDDGKVEFEDGFVVITQSGHNELDEQVGDLIEEELRTNVQNHEFVKHIDYLQDVLAKLDDERSPLHLISGLSKVSAKSKVQEEIFDIAVEAWEDNVSRQKKKIENLSSSLVETKIHQYILLDQQITQKTVELVEHSAPAEDSKFADELFQKMQTDLVHKSESESSKMFESIRQLILLKLDDRDPTKKSTQQISKSYELYDGFVSKYRIWDDAKLDYVKPEIDDLSHSRQVLLATRKRVIVDDIKRYVERLPADKVKPIFVKLVDQYPDSKNLAALIGVALPKKTKAVSSATPNSSASNSSASASDGDKSTDQKKTTTGADPEGQGKSPSSGGKKTIDDSSSESKASATGPEKQL